MSKIAFLALIAFLVTGCAEENFSFPSSDCYWRDRASEHPRHISYQELIENFQQQGLPGISLLVAKKDEPIWVSSCGYAELESGLALSPCHVMPVGSVGKLYCATAVMMMIEDGLLDLETPVSAYLSDDLSSQIPNGSTATLAHLLSHTSGIPDYADSRLLYLDLLNNKNMDFSRESILEQFVFGSKPLFSPGSEYRYSNSNYEIQTLIMDQVYPQGHADFYSFRLFTRLGLEKTYYKKETDYFSLYANSMANGYFDRHSTAKLENATDLSLTIASGQTGSDGIVTTTFDLYKFMEALFTGHLLPDERFVQMKEYIKENAGFQTYKYGLGLVYKDFDPFGIAIGHSGSLPGFSTEAWYFKDQDTFVIYSINCGNLINGPLQSLIDEEFQWAVLETIFNQ